VFERTGDNVRLIAPSPFAVQRVARAVGAELNAIAREITGADDAVMRIETKPANTLASRPAPPAVVERRPSAGAPVRRAVESDMSLDAFVVGPCNELAHKAAVSIAETGSAGASRGVFLHGECGMGKTHLLRGIAERFRATHPGARVLYETGEKFTNAFLAALRSGDLDSFRERRRNLDLYCLDDVHFFSRKTKTQDEFLHTFDEMDLGGASVALASDEPPGRIARLSRELVSRFSAGVVARLDALDPATARRVVRTIAARRAVPLTEDAAAVVARLCDGSPRRIVGALSRIDACRTLLSGARFTGGPVDAAAARAALGSEFGAAGRWRRLRLDDIIRVTARTLGVSVEEVLSTSRRGRVVVARSLASHLARTLAGRSYQEIADALRRSTHSTAFTACKRVEAKIAAGEAVGVALDVPAQTWADLALEVERRLREACSRPGGGD